MQDKTEQDQNDKAPTEESVADAKSTEVSPDDTKGPDDTQVIVEDAEIMEASQDKDAEVGTGEADTVEPETVEPKDTSPEPVVAAPVQQTIVKKAGFAPLFLGGLVAGVIGYGAAYFGYANINDGVEAAQREQQRALQAVGDDVTAIQADVAAALTSQDLDAGLSGLETQLTQMAASLEALDGRVAALESLPAASGEGASVSMLALESEMQALRDLVQDQKTDLQAAAQDAAAIEDAARNAARLETARAAMGQLKIAAETGKPFEDALADLAQNTDAEIPVALSDSAATGIPPLGDLQESFADQARAALAIVRAEDADGNATGSRLANFLRAQTGARSVEPREGNDADAVLSRVEASVKAGNLTDALAEIEVLPEVGRAALSDWTGSATRRLEAVNALNALDTALATN
ncbi:COG4223 family protein [Algirhabdus cladophorae]|uniref:COG4223 family protein n=1 Tax=Algirhabdus cladophorae TaxID=3377108 RepID=UPI003B84B212